MRYLHIKFHHIDYIFNRIIENTNEEICLQIQFSCS